MGHFPIHEKYIDLDGSCISLIALSSSLFRHLIQFFFFQIDFFPKQIKIPKQTVDVKIHI